MALKRKTPSKKRRKPAWRVMIPGGKLLPSMTLDQLRAMKDAHAYLTRPIAGPPRIALAIQGFRYLEMFGAACLVENKYPALTRCWNDLAMFKGNPAFAEGMFIPSWVLIDFPCGPASRTALDHFESFLATSGQLPRFKPFIDAARASRLGLYEDVLRSRDVARFRELFTHRVVDVYPSMEAGDPGEIVLVRVLEIEGQSYFWGDMKAFPAQARDAIENMVLDKLLDLGSDDTDPLPKYETFMKLAGPYWASIVAEGEDLPILEPNHLLGYYDER